MGNLSNLQTMNIGDKAPEILGKDEQGRHHPHHPDNGRLDVEAGGVDGRF